MRKIEVRSHQLLFVDHQNTGISLQIDPAAASDSLYGQVDVSHLTQDYGLQVNQQGVGGPDRQTHLQTFNCDILFVAQPEADEVQHFERKISGAVGFNSLHYEKNDMKDCWP